MFSLWEITRPRNLVWSKVSASPFILLKLLVIQIQIIGSFEKEIVTFTSQVFDHTFQFVSDKDHSTKSLNNANGGLFGDIIAGGSAVRAHNSGRFAYLSILGRLQI